MLTTTFLKRPSYSAWGISSAGLGSRSKTRCRLPLGRNFKCCQCVFSRDEMPATSVYRFLNTRFPLLLLLVHKVWHVHVYTGPLDPSLPHTRTCSPAQHHKHPALHLPCTQSISSFWRTLPHTKVSAPHFAAESSAETWTGTCLLALMTCQHQTAACKLRLIPQSQMDVILYKWPLV